MIELGRVQELMVVREKNFGVYLGQKKDDAAAVLLPKKQVPEGTKVGDKLKVFIYKDSEDRLIATTSMPKLELGGTAVLKVKDVSKIGAFLDMGLEKDLLLPFKEQVYPVRAGEECLVALYIDKSGRLAATMKVYSYLCSDAPYKKDEWTEGRVYEINENLGVFVAVADRYFGLIPNRELYGKCRLGEVLKDAEAVLARLKEKNGVLPFNDRVEPEIIRREFNLSKNAFKRAVGHLLKEGKVEVNEDSIRLK